jgi:hypothetical protein
MLFRKTYSFEFPRNKDLLIQDLKEVSKKDLVEENKFGSDTLYSVEFNWDEFIVTPRAKMFQRSNFTPDAYIRLNSISEELTLVNVTIKYSEISWLFLIFIQLWVIVGCLFVPEFHWLIRIPLLIGATGLWGLMIHWGIHSEVENFKEVVGQLFQQVEEN